MDAMEKKRLKEEAAMLKEEVSIISGICRCKTISSPIVSEGTFLVFWMSPFSNHFNVLKTVFPLSCLA